MKLCLHCQQTFSTDDWCCTACGSSPAYHNGFPVFAAPDSGDGFRPELFAELAVLESQNFWFQARNKLIIWALKRFFPHFDRLLEVGCGTGFVLSGIAQEFPAAQLSGSEYFAEGLPYASTRVPEATLCQADARKLPFRDEFDVIGAFDVLEHIAEDESSLAQCFRALRPGGGVVLTVPQHPWLWSKADQLACHERRYTRSELLNKLRSAGFTIAYASSFVSLLMPAMALSRFRRGVIDDSTDPLADLRLHPLLNKVFSVVMTLERGLIRCGVAFPWGGSLLVVAKKPGSGADR